MTKLLLIFSLLLTVSVFGHPNKRIKSMGKLLDKAESKEIPMKIDTVKSISGHELAYFIEYSDHSWCPHSKLDEDYPNNMAIGICYGGEPVSTPYIKKNYRYKYDTTYYLTSWQIKLLQDSDSLDYVSNKMEYPKPSYESTIGTLDAISGRWQIYRDTL